MANSPGEITAESTMQEVLERYPGAQRALMRRILGPRECSHGYIAHTCTTCAEDRRLHATCTHSARDLIPVHRAGRRTSETVQVRVNGERLEQAEALRD